MTDGQSGSDDDNDMTDADAELDDLAEPVETVVPFGNDPDRTADQTAAADDEQDGRDGPSPARDELDELDELSQPVTEIMPVGSREDTGELESDATDKSGLSETDGGADD